MVFSGTINVNSGESPDGTLLIGRIFDSNDKILYTSNSVKVSGNKYVALTLGPMESVAVGKLIKFYFLCAEIPCTDAAAETINYASAKVKFRYSLTFNKVPPTQSELDAAANAKADAQTASQAKANKEASDAIAKAKADAEAAAKAKADAEAAAAAKVDEVVKKTQSKTDAAVATKAVAKVDPEPQTAYPSVYSGSILIAGTEIPDNAVLTAKIGDYTSPQAIITGNSFQNLVISPGNSTYIDKPIIFMLNNVESEPIVELYKPGLTKDLKLIFVGLPIETKVNEEPKEISSPSPSSPSPSSPSPDTSSGSNCSFVSSNNNKDYSGAISLALMLLVPLIAFKSTKNK